MDQQVVLNSIGTLSSTIDALNRAGKKEAIDVVVKKVLDLVEQIKVE